MTSAPATRFLDRTTPPHVSTLILLAGMSAAAMNIFLPSLPSMTVHFQTDYALMQASVTLYLAGSAILALIAGPLSDRFGRRTTMLWGIALFVVATAGCLLATDIWTFLACRMLQSVMTVGMVLGRATIRDLHSTDRAASMIGYVTMGMAIVPMFAPLIGGVLDQLLGWRASFWLLLLLGFAIFALTWTDQGETSTRSGRSIWRQFADYPGLFRSQRFWGYALAAMFASGAFFSYLGGAPYVGSEVFHMSPAKLGFYFGAPAIGYALGNFVTGRFAQRHGVNRMVLWGSVVNASGVGVSLCVFLTGLGNEVTFFAFMTLVGLGNGLVIPNATSGMLSVRPELAGTASGLGGAIMVGGGAALGHFAGIALEAGTGAFPLLWIMFGTSSMAVVCILWVIRRTAQVARQKRDQPAL